MLGKPFPFLGHQMVQITFLGGLSGSRSSGDTSRPCPHVPVGCSIWAGQKLNCGVIHRSCPPLLGLGWEGQPWIPRWTTRRQDLHCTFPSVGLPRGAGIIQWRSWGQGHLGLRIWHKRERSPWEIATCHHFCATWMPQWPELERG